jgi:hypothetical protein
MVVSATGRRAARKNDKDPIRVAVGRRCAESENHPSKSGRRVRSHHLGYDCYATGLVNGSGKIRCAIRPGRTPPHIAPDIVAILPMELWWPEKDHDQAHAMIDAVMQFDLSSLAAWRATWPEHEFGFERFMEHAERRIAAVRNENIPDVPELPPRLDGTAAVGHNRLVAVQGGAPLPRQLALFPGRIQSVEIHGTVAYDGYEVETALVRFEDGLAALRIDVGGRMVDGTQLLCSRAYLDLVSSDYEVVKHYPGRLRALSLPVDLIYRVLGVRPGPTGRTERTAPWKQPPHSPPLEQARRAQGVLAAGEAGAPPAHVPKSEPEPVLVPGNAQQSKRRQAYEARLERDPENTLVEHFPAAPGQPGGPPAGSGA